MESLHLKFYQLMGSFGLYEPHCGKPAFCKCENKDADQLRGNREADQRLCFCYIDSTIPLLSKYETSSLQPSSVTAQPCLCRTMSETPETCFLTTRLVYAATVVPIYNRYASFCCCFFIQFNVPFKMISLILRQANRKMGRNWSTPGKPPDTPASRTWLISHVASAGLNLHQS